MHKKLFLIVTVFCLYGCDTALKRSDDISQTDAMKYTTQKQQTLELYSWKASGIWNYVLVTADSPVRSFESIVSSGEVIKGTDEFIKKLENLKGRDIFWNLVKIQGFSYPPDESVLTIVKHAEELGVKIEPINY